MFSGLVRCGVCGSSYTVKNRDQLACSAHREKGTCNNNRTIRVEELERRVLQGIERRLLAPDAIAEFLLEYHAEQKRLRAATTKKRREAEKRLGGIMRQIKSIISAIADGIATREMKTTLLEIDREKEALENELLSFEQLDTVVELHPAAVDAYRRAVAKPAERIDIGRQRASGGGGYYPFAHHEHRRNPARGARARRAACLRRLGRASQPAKSASRRTA